MPIVMELETYASGTLSVFFPDTFCGTKILQEHTPNLKGPGKYPNTRIMKVMFLDLCFQPLFPKWTHSFLEPGQL